jgi:hypothetical protein
MANQGWCRPSDLRFSAWHGGRYFENSWGLNF